MKRGAIEAVDEKLYMVIERFLRGPQPVYDRFLASGRMQPDGLEYVSSWIDKKMETCYQVMRTADRALLERWMERWADLMSFEVIPVITSSEAALRMRPDVDRRGL